MFISNSEKEVIRITMQAFQNNLSNALAENKSMKQAIIDLEGRINALEKSAKRPAKKEKKQILRTPEAPYGYKLDGTPKKRPGKPLPTTPEAQECITPI